MQLIPAPGLFAGEVATLILSSSFGLQKLSHFQRDLSELWHPLLKVFREEEMPEINPREAV